MGAFVNDGTKEYDKDRDGTELRVAHCDINVVGKDYTFIRISYLKNKVLVVEYNEDENETKECFRVNNLNLPEAGYMGLTALTGMLSANYEIFSITTSKITEANIKPLAQETKEQTSIWKVIVLFIVLGALVYIGIRYYEKYQDRSMKRF